MGQLSLYITVSIITPSLHELNTVLISCQSDLQRVSYPKSG